MKRLLIYVLIILLSLSVLRSVNGANPLGLSGFLEAVSTVDLDFTETLESVAALKDSLEYPVVASSSFFDKMINFYYWIYEICFSIIRIPIAIVVDILDFLYSIFEFFYKLLGMDFNPDNKFGEFGSGGFGGGGGGAR